MSKRIYDATADDFRKALVGRRIVATTDDTITLDDGTVLEIEDTGDCCAYFNGAVRRLAETDNIITDVREDDLESADPEAFRVVAVAAGLDVAAVDIEGDSTSGYYCHSVILNVKEASND